MLFCVNIFSHEKPSDCNYYYPHLVLAQKRALESEILLHTDERGAIYNLLPGPKRRYGAGSDGTPMFHHYSWVRTKEEMLQKVRSWGCKEDRDWVNLVREEFAAPFRGTDFVRGYSYRSIPPRFDIRFEEVHFQPKGAPQVKRLKNSELLSLVKQKKFWNFLDF